MSFGHVGITAHKHCYNYIFEAHSDVATGNVVLRMIPLLQVSQTLTGSHMMVIFKFLGWALVGILADSQSGDAHGVLHLRRDTWGQFSEGAGFSSQTDHVSNLWLTCAACNASKQHFLSRDDFCTFPFRF